MISAVVSGGITNFFTSPIWVVKTRMQAHIGREPKYKSSFHAMRSIYREEGLRSLYRGLVPSFVGLIHVGIQFPFSEELEEHANISLLNVVLSSSISKLIASIAAYPHEVLRSRFQEHRPSGVSDARSLPYKNLRDACKRIYNEEGVAAFYRGMGTNLLRVVPAAVITLSVYEMTAKWLTKSVYGGM
ncbi:mitochondrial substrate carrier family protein [Acrasis kona]|uniref:Mitochondrial substrate carrier family protein n=1 Tax=Acrasis kona TaxID=1008807 RepID=A0AAW2ZAH2_9EUKA